MKRSTLMHKNNIVNDRFAKFIVDYKIEDDKLRIISNTGKTRVVENNESNLSKMNQVIVKNKIAIANKIDEYENTAKERLFILITNIILLGFAGVFVPFAFFTGKYLFFLFSVVCFSVAVITTSVICFDHYILAKEIQSLKKITGYKKDREFNIPELNLKNIKSH